MEKNSKKSIIIGITVLLLVSLILIGLTYAYYRTRIVGNDADTSISVQSKKMEVTYEDGTSVLSTEGNVEPGFTASKTFYVENTGDMEVSYSIVLEDMTNEFSRNEDWQYTLTENGTQIAVGYLAVGAHQVLVGSTTIAETTGTKNTYVLTLTYLNSDEDQSEDMGMNLSFKVNISDEQYTFVTAPSGSLLYALKNNQPTGTETTVPGQASTTENEARLVTTEDDYGTSYVYRGNVTNNYVNYSGMCWRIVRIQGDGSIKLALADENGECDASTYLSTNTKTAFINSAQTYTNSVRIYADSPIPTELSTWMTSKITDTSDLVETEWCNDTSMAGYYSAGSSNYYYGAYDRINPTSSASPSLKCNFKGLENSKATRYKSNIGVLTADEVLFAGTVSMGGNKTYYLYANASYGNAWTMSPFDNSTYTMYRICSGGGPGDCTLSSLGVIRPVVVLNPNVTIEDGGAGTQTNPYVIS